MKLPAPLRTVVADLIERRLWPVALLLVAALVATPIVLVRGSGEDASATAAIPATPADPADQSAVTLATGELDPAANRGAERDPFTQRAVEAARAGGGLVSATGGTATPAAAATGGTTSSQTPGVSGDSAGGTSLGDIGVVPVGGSTGGAIKPAPADELDSWHVDLRFGKDGTLSTKNDVPRLSPLPSQADPFFVFLGIAADGKTAMFLVSSDATATGDGKCLPTAENCDRVELQAGETEFFDVATPAGEVVQYQLDLVRVSRRTAASAAMATAARSRESDAGREVLRKAVDTKQVDISGLSYSQRLGLVIPNGAGDQNSALFGGYRVDLQFGAPGALVKRYNLARLTPLPSVDDPSFVYLGVLGDGKTALFLNPSEAAAAGDAVCEPSPEECQRVKIEAGKSATFAAPAIDGSTTEYQLDIDGITPVQATTAEEAAASRKRESPAGRVILRRLIQEVGSLVGDLTFAPGKGVVESAPATAAPAPAPAQTEAPKSAE
jgi:hypothetical protein